MERYYNEDHEKDEDPFFHSDENEEEDEEEIAYMDQGSIIDVMQIDLNKISLNQALLDRAIAVAQKSFWWRFMSTDKRLSEIDKIYKALFRLTDEDATEVEEIVEEGEESAPL